MADLVHVQPIGGTHAVTVSLDRPPMNVLDLARSAPCQRRSRPSPRAACSRLIGRAAWEMVLLGSSISAVRAAELGLVTRVVDDPPEAIGTWAKWLCGKSGAVLALARRALREGAHGSFAEGLARTEKIYREELTRTEDVEEGVRAFLEKRRPHWSDR